MYELGPDRLLFVTSDRVSAFDVVMAEPVPDKGRVLTALTAFWAAELAGVAPNHLLQTEAPPAAELAAAGIDPAYAEGRSMLVRKAQMLPIECIVRGYLSGSAWAEYKRSRTMHGQPLPEGMRQSDKLPEPVFTPSTKAASGHDENISFEAAAGLVGDKVASAAREISLEAYRLGAERASARGIIIADTKFELGVINGELAICDEILTPDSSRFWAADAWQPGTTAPSFDKQPVRDWAESTGWDKQSAPPPMPAEVIAATRDRYVSAYEQISGLSFSQWWGVSEASQR